MSSINLDGLLVRLSNQDVIKIFERSDYDISIKYVPHSPGPESENILQMFHKRKVWKKCLHHLYKTTEEFINHILWLLYPSAAHDPIYFAHCNYMASSLSGIDSLMCTNCVSVLLATVSFNDIINLYGVWNRDRLILERGFMNSSLCSALHHQVYKHPKLYKILAKTCSLNLNKNLKLKELPTLKQIKLLGVSSYDFHYHNFDFVCDLVIGPCAVIHQTTHPQCIHAISDLRTFFLSIKYWNKYHLLFFARNFFANLNHSMLILKKHMDGNAMETIADGTELATIFVNLAFISRYFAYRCMNMHGVLQEIGNFNVDLMHGITLITHPPMKQINNERKKVKQLMNDNIKCSWTNCNKLQNNAKEKFKICSGCKMVYYCSIKCQKKSWVTEHRNICCKLSEYYHI